MARARATGWILAASLGCLVLLASCGGGGENLPTARPTITQSGLPSPSIEVPTPTLPDRTRTPEEPSRTRTPVLPDRTRTPEQPSPTSTRTRAPETSAPTSAGPTSAGPTSARPTSTTTSAKPTTSSPAPTKTSATATSSGTASSAAPNTPSAEQSTPSVAKSPVPPTSTATPVPVAESGAPRWLWWVLTIVAAAIVTAIVLIGRHRRKGRHTAANLSAGGLPPGDRADPES